MSLTVRKVPSGTAITSGTALHSGSLDLKTAANSEVALTLSSTLDDLVLAQGDSIALDFSGVLTSTAGNVTVGLAPR